jgi:dCMP deaminase
MCIPDGYASFLPGLLEQRLFDRPSWKEYFLAIAKIISTRSTCSSRPVGCIIVKDNRILVSGYNGPPPGAPHCSDRNKNGQIFCMRRAENVPDSMKHELCPSTHAEENALSLAERLGINVAGASIYTTLAPCIRCIGSLQEHGLKNVYYELEYRSVDLQRDRIWEKTACEHFDTYEQVSISQQSLSKLVGALIGVTSDRLLPSR